MICLCEEKCRKLPQNAYFGRFWEVYLCKVSYQTNEHFGRHRHVDNDTLTNFSYGTLIHGSPEIPLVEARCHFAINFTTWFHKLQIIRDSKTPVKQPPSLGGTTTTWITRYFMVAVMAYDQLDTSMMKKDYKICTWNRLWQIISLWQWKQHTKRKFMLARFLRMSFIFQLYLG